MEQKRGPGYESKQLHPPNFLTKFPNTYNGEKKSSSTNAAGKTGYLPTRIQKT
jgi:hypothetical protein